jgi:hypothetical protein
MSLISNSGGLVLLGNATEGVKEQTVTEFHDVGFVDASNFLFRDVSAQQTKRRWGKPTLRLFFQGEIEGESNNTLGLGTDLRFSNSRRHREYSGVRGQSTLLRYSHG